MISRLRKALPFLLVAVLAAAAYDGWLFYSRWSGAREAEHQSQANEAEAARRVIDQLGGGGLKILNFYATPGTIHPGEHSTVCYGVFGAEKVRIEPLPDDLRPAVTHCMQVAPSKTTEYKLVATDSKGHTATQALTIRVK